MILSFSTNLMIWLISLILCTLSLSLSLWLSRVLLFYKKSLFRSSRLSRKGFHNCNTLFKGFYVVYNIDSEIEFNKIPTTYIKLWGCVCWGFIFLCFFFKFTIYGFILSVLNWFQTCNSFWKFVLLYYFFLP